MPVKCLCTSKAAEQVQRGLSIRVARTVVFCCAGSAFVPVKCLCTSEATEQLQRGLRIRVARTVVFCCAGSAFEPVKCLCTSKATEQLQRGLRIRVARSVVFNFQSDLASIRYMKNETDENRRENIKWLRLEAALHCADDAEV